MIQLESLSRSLLKAHLKWSSTLARVDDLVPSIEEDAVHVFIVHEAHALMLKSLLERTWPALAWRFDVMRSLSHIG